MKTTLEAIELNYSDADKALFENDQGRHWSRIEEYYSILRERCLDEIQMPLEATHRVWVTSRVNRLLVTSLMRLLYLGESFCDASLKFNAPSAAVHVKAMVEPVLHIANLVWILEHYHNDFEQIRTELDRMAFGRSESGLTASARISQKELYRRADEIMNGYKESEAEDDLNVFETLYKEANATGHHNFEGRDVLIGQTDFVNHVWRPADRKQWFVFISSNVFQFFLHTGVVFSMSSVFVGHIDHYLENMPEMLTDPSDED